MAKGNFTEGKILGPLMAFAFPVLLALLLQSLYGAVDLLVVGQFSTSADVSAVSTGSQIMSTLTNVIAGLSMGTTVLIGQEVGRNDKREAGRIVGASIAFFLITAVVLTAVMLFQVENVARIMNAPEEAFDATCDYLFICSAGLLFIIGYNLIGSLFRGMGNSRLPLLTVAIAAVINIFGDLLLTGYFHMGAAGAAYATVLSQAVSVIISFAVIRKMPLNFDFEKKDITIDTKRIARIVGVGFPIALADLIVGLSFLVIIAIVNQLGVTASAGVGVAEKVCGFIMLVPSAFGQSMAAFVAQNYGARKMDRAYKALRYGIAVSFAMGAVMALASFFKGDILCAVFSKDPEVIAAGWEYLKAYGVDCLITPFFFNMNGFFNGCGYTKFVMAENITGGVAVRLPVSYLMSKIKPISLFKIGLATPCASFLQAVFCFLYMFLVVKKKETQS